MHRTLAALAAALLFLPSCNDDYKHLQEIGQLKNQIAGFEAERRELTACLKREKEGQAAAQAAADLELRRRGSPLARELAALVGPDAKLPKPLERHGDSAMYTLDVPGGSATLDVDRRTGAWDVVVNPSTGRFGLDTFGRLRKLCEDGAPIGPNGERGTTTYLIETGPLVGAFMEWPRSPSTPDGGDQVVLWNLSRARETNDRARVFHSCPAKVGLL